jgi:polysaccharide export outer membrane protein
MKLVRFLTLFATGIALASLPAFGQAPAKSDNKKNYVHTLSLADRVRVAVYQEDDLTSLTRIDARGRINMPLLGEIAIGGMTVTEAQTAIENAYKEGRFLRNPQVTISVEEYAPREVSISGAIRSAGRYTLPIESTLTVVELVTKAGGITDIGKGTAVTVTRMLPDGTKKVFTVNVDAAIKGKKSTREEDSSFMLLPGDNVYVPESLF